MRLKIDSKIVKIDILLREYTHVGLLIVVKNDRKNYLFSFRFYFYFHNFF